MMTRVESIDQEQEQVMTGKWFQSSYFVFVSIVSDLVKSLFPQSNPQQLPSSRPPTPLNSNSNGMKTLPSSSEGSSSETSSETSSTAHTVLQSSESQRVNSKIVQLFRDQELGKTLLTYVIPISVGVLTVYPKHSLSLPVPAIVLSLCIGLTALWNGILLRNTLPDPIANVMEQFGAGCIFFSFFAVVSSLLPPNLVWVPWTCFVIILLPSVLSCLPVKDTCWVRLQKILGF